MAWFEFEPDVIRFDSDDINAMRKKLLDTKKEIEEECETIMETVNQLQKDWLTPEGQKFLSEIDFDWVKQVKKYVLVLNTLSDMLSKAYTIYDDVTEEAKTIKF